MCGINVPRSPSRGKWAWCVTKKPTSGQVGVVLMGLRSPPRRGWVLIFLSKNPTSGLKVVLIYAHVTIYHHPHTYINLHSYQTIYGQCGHQYQKYFVKRYSKFIKMV